MKKLAILLALIVVGVSGFLIFKKSKPIDVVDEQPNPEKLVVKNTKSTDDNPQFVPKKSLSDKSVDVSKIEPTEQDQHEKDELEDLKENVPDAYDYHTELTKIISKGYGLSKPIQNLDHPQVKSVIEAIKTKKFPERLSVAVKPSPFNQSKYLNDEAYKLSYLNTCEPGRCHQSLEPGQGVPALKRTAAYMHEITQGEKVILSVSTGIKGAPVTFSSLHLGQLSNGLTSQTIECDDQGNASVEFFRSIRNCRRLSCSLLKSNDLWSD